ncbi:MAG: hypothetical protein U0869_16485 [Chloroflexota bacterium]
MTQTIAAAAGAAADAASAAVSVPLVDAGRGVAGRVAGTVQRYLEQWEDRIHEVQAERTHRFERQELTVEVILGDLERATVVSDTPGRVRLRVPALRRQHALAAQTTDALSQLEGVRLAEVNPWTGSVLVLYDARRFPSLGTFLAAVPKRRVRTARRTSRTS